MAKQIQHQRASDRNVTLEQQTLMDDSLLPPAEELSKLNTISPDIVKWVLARTEKEQEARIEFNQKRIRLAEYDLKSIHKFNFLALIFAFLIIAAGMGISFLFIVNGMNIQGTIFAGGTLVTAAYTFIKATNNKRNIG